MFILFSALLLSVVRSEYDLNALFPVNVYWYTDPVEAPFTYFKSSMIVPPVPSKEWQTLFIWPGLQPIEAPDSGFDPINNGVLQPVLTWGDSCAPNPSEETFDKNEVWWISAQYVNTFGNYSGYTGCNGGNQMAVYPDDILDIIMEKATDSNIWTQTVINRSNNKSVDFEIDMQNQNQAWAEFVMETPSTWQDSPPQWKVFDIELRSTSPHSTFCTQAIEVANVPGGNVTCSTPEINGNVCTIARCDFNGYKDPNHKRCKKPNHSKKHSNSKTNSKH